MRTKRDGQGRAKKKHSSTLAFDPGSPSPKSLFQLQDKMMLSWANSFSKGVHQHNRANNME